ncbi:NAD(P)H-binding protein [Winogradskyella aurantiaca]|uniref:NAD(P)H-binding protein n=1 Tax=Winogradskyella aurantiaca TaxID=2219558 RepID=UPI000E1D2857|nr:NAD(P)H-binding protein [Winogradskyella aurantiaca]
MSEKQISIIGCGWLGLPLAKKLASHGYKIKGSTTSVSKLKNLKEAGIEPYHVQLHASKITGDIDGFLRDSTIVIINIPPGLRKNPNKDHVSEISRLLKAIQKASVKHILYVSSISVFEDDTDFPVITNTSTPNGTSNSAQQLIAIEKSVLALSRTNTSVLRFAGLIDDQRHPGNQLAGRTGLLNPKAPLNLIHKEDCINIILKILEKKIWGKVLNASYPYHPAKKDYYTAYSESKNLPLPSYDYSQPSKGKVIDSSKLEQLLLLNMRYRP